MRKPRIYSEQQLQVDCSIDLSERVANHVGHVLRMKPGESLVLFNGQGGAWMARIENVNKRSIIVYIESYIEGDAQSPLTIELGQTLSRGERMDYVIQKATEVGVTSITPLWSERCEVKLNAERQDKRVKHWQQLAISACEQCGRNIVPTIHAPVKLENWLSSRATELNFVLHHRTHEKLNGFEQPESVSLLIGPEGGLTSQEIKLAESYHFNPLVLGPRILRTETAPIVAVSLMQYLWGDY